jgi:radical SAM protein with 4Fe4S-binding SPASM domain
MAFKGFPFFLGWELTLACNLKCKHCGSSASSKRPQELTLEESLAICDQFPDLLVQEVDFTGGEPLLNENWIEVASYLNKFGIISKILTNGLILNDDLISQMEDVNIAGIGISLDGLENTHDMIRGYPGQFKKIMAGIELILKSKIPLTIITTVNALNINEVSEIYTQLRTIGVLNWRVQPIFSLGRVRDNSDLILTEQDYLTLGKFVQNLEAEVSVNGFKLLPSDSFGYFTDYDNRDPPWRGCPAGLYSCGITSDGKIKGCLSLPDKYIEGDLRKNDLWDIWNGADAFEYTRKFSSEKLGPNCRNCEKASDCQGGCSAMSIGYTEQFNNDPFCFLGIQGRNR